MPPTKNLKQSSKITMSQTSSKKLKSPKITPKQKKQIVTSEDKTALPKKKVNQNPRQPSIIKVKIPGKGVAGKTNTVEEKKVTSETTKKAMKTPNKKLGNAPQKTQKAELVGVKKRANSEKISSPAKKLKQSPTNKPLDFQKKLKKTELLQCTNEVNSEKISSPAKKLKQSPTNNPLDFQKKLKKTELLQCTNEVATAQLSKNPLFLQFEAAYETKQPRKKIVRKAPIKKQPVPKKATKQVVKEKVPQVAKESINPIALLSIDTTKIEQNDTPNKRGKKRPKKIMPSGNISEVNNSLSADVVNIELKNAAHLKNNAIKSTPSKCTAKSKVKNNAKFNNNTTAAHTNVDQIFKETAKSPVLLSSQKICSRSKSIETLKSNISDTFSWAENISSSSGTSARSIVCIDGKLPVVGLLDIKNVLDLNSSISSAHSIRKLRKRKSDLPCPKVCSKKEKKIPSSEKPNVPDVSPRFSSPVSSSYSKSSTDDLTSSSESSLFLKDGVRSAHLSSSSYSSSSKSCVFTPPIVQSIKSLRQQLSFLNTKFLDWLSKVDENENDSPIDNNGVDEDNNETETLEIVNMIKGTLSDLSECGENIVKVTQLSSPDLVDQVDHSVDPTNKELIQVSNPCESYHTNNVNDYVEEPSNSTKSSYDNYYQTEIARRHSTNYDDDDDALSLYAESITGLDSSRINSTMSVCNSPDRDLDLNQIEPDILDKDQDKCDVEESPTVKEMETDSVVCEPAVTSTSVISEPPVSNQCKKEDLVTAMVPTKSNVFKGYCFFNLISNCKKNRCVFPHKCPEQSEIRTKLTTLSETNFMMEYLLVRKFPPLRDQYMYCFVEECSRRDLTRVLVQMTIDANRENEELKKSVNEVALLNLNEKNIDEIEDLLLHRLAYNVCLCDVYMKTIAETQNFSRFKSVFVKLTEFIVFHNRRFDLNVASLIIERVAILPYQESIASAVVDIIKKTSKIIFKDTMMMKFEEMLSKQNSTLFRDLRSYKDRVVDQDKNAESDTYTSPDTTYMDSKARTKSFGEIPLITRTIDNMNITKTFLQEPIARLKRLQQQIERSPSIGQQPNFLLKKPTFLSDSLSNHRGRGPGRTWRGKTIFNRIPKTGYLPHVIQRPRGPTDRYMNYPRLP